jgi:hypothetical protein
MPSNMSFTEDARGLQKGKMTTARVLAARTNPLWYVLGATLLICGGFYVFLSWKSPGGVRPAGGARAMRAPGLYALGPTAQALAAAAVPEAVEAPPAAAVVAAPSAAGLAPAPAAVAAVSDGRKRTIVLYSADGRINTGVWPSWGGDPPSSATLNWGSAGVVVEKSCPVECTVTHDNGLMAQADAVLCEILNWPKFGLSGDMPLPERTRANPRGPSAPKLPLLGLFGYEPRDYFPTYSLANPAVAESFAFSMTHDASNTLPITLVCPWGRPVANFFAPPPAKQEGRLLMYFSEHGAAPGMSAFVEELFAAAGQGIHAYVHKRNMDLPPEAVGTPYALENRLAFYGTYKFLFITEQVEEADFLSNEWSQALQAGVVPVYLGIPNIAQYALPGAWVDARRFSSGGALWEYLKTFDGGGEEVDKAYARFFAWKDGARAAAAEDGEGALGTGQGVALNACAKADVEVQASWPLAPPVGKGELPEAAKGEALLKASKAAWRCFRKHLDSCVHYSECRMCRYVHENT